MNEPILSATILQNYRLLQRLFIFGCILNIISTFIPSAIVKTAGFFTVEEQSMSTQDAIRLAFRMGQGAIGFLGVLIFAAYVAFAVLAYRQPKRWVFIAGASVAAFTFLLELFSPGNQNVESLFLPKLLLYLGTFAMLSGYFVKPSAPTTTTA